MTSSHDNRSRRISIRLSGKEYEKLERNWKQSSDQHLSNYVRKVLLDKPVRMFTHDRSRDHFMEEAALLRRELSALGNNFNQVVRNINAIPAAELRSFWLKTATSMQQELLGRIRFLEALFEKMWTSWSPKS